MRYYKKSKKYTEIRRRDPTSFTYLSHLFIDLIETFAIQSQICHSLHLSHSQKCHKPLVGVALGGCGSCVLCTSFTLLSHLMTDLDKTNVIQSQIFHRLHISNFLKGHTPQGATPPGCHTPYMPHPLRIEMLNIYSHVKSQVPSMKND